jgi:hypothetical protein
MKFPDASGVSVNMLPISDGSAFDQLKLLLEREGDNLAGPDWLGMLAAIGLCEVVFRVTIEFHYANFKV